MRSEGLTSSMGGGYRFLFFGVGQNINNNISTEFWGVFCVAGQCGCPGLAFVTPGYDFGASVVLFQVILVKALQRQVHKASALSL